MYQISYSSIEKVYKNDVYVDCRYTTCSTMYFVKNIKINL